MTSFIIICIKNTCEATGAMNIFIHTQGMKLYVLYFQPYAFIATDQ